MADVFSREKRSAVMSRIRSRGNKNTEMVLVDLFRAKRINGWRRNARLFGKPDFIFRKARLAVFIDGCFWHGCPQHGTRPKSNAAYWQEKLLRNQIRDRLVDRELAARGWRVLRFWEHDLRDAAEIADYVARATARR